MTSKEVFLEPTVVYEDSALVVIDKPAGMIVNVSQTSGGNTVQEWFGRKYLTGTQVESESEFGRKGGVVHRLDKDTSGIMVLARTANVYEKLKQQFLERHTHKVYWALVHGTLTEKAGILSKPIVRHPKLFGKFTVGEDLSLMAVTEWKVDSEYTQPEKLSELTLKPMTGRTHQLRVHLKFLGHPIVGDSLYVGRNVLKSDREWCPRMCLHAMELKFVHPVDDLEMSFETKLPTELEQVRVKLVH